MAIIKPLAEPVVPSTPTRYHRRSADNNRTGSAADPEIQRDYRVIFKIEEEIVYVLGMRHRKSPSFHSFIRSFIGRAVFPAMRGSALPTRSG